MRKTWRAVGRNADTRVKGLFALVCSAVCALILLTSAAARLAKGIAEDTGMPEATISPKPTIVLERSDVEEDVDIEFLIELIRTESVTNDTLELTGDEPRVLIYHTHTKEGYFPSSEHSYEPESGWRNPNDDMNIVAVGERLAELLREEYGVAVLHDTTNHEPPKLSTSYSRSLETMLAYKEEYPSLTLFIDLHRDAYGEPVVPSDYIVIDGREVARIMFVVGTGKGATGTGFDEMPDFNSNYELAKRLTEYLTSLDEGLVRNIRVKSGRYNQHVSSACLLAEIGHNANTFEQAMNAVEYLAEAIANAASLQEKPQTEETMLPLAP